MDSNDLATELLDIIGGIGALTVVSENHEDGAAYVKGDYCLGARLSLTLSASVGD